MVEQIIPGLRSELQSSIVGPTEGSWVLGKRGVKESLPLEGQEKRTMGCCPQTSSDADCVRDCALQTYSSGIQCLKVEIEH